jgi:xeroderma pigmentosum group C-complementing protein
MCPEGAVHVPFRGAIKVCKRLQIDYAEAVVDFEFGHRMAVPVIQGVVIAEEYHDQVMEELRNDEAERIRKEDEKRRKAALGRWRKFLMGMRIVKRIREEYGHIDDSVSVFGHHKGGAPQHQHAAKVQVHGHDEDMGGGFLPEGYEEDGDDGDESAHQTSSFFPVGGDEDEDEDEAGGAKDGLIMEDHRDEAAERTSKVEEPPEQSLPKTSKSPRASRAKPKNKSAAPQRQSSRGNKQVSYDEEDEESEESWDNPDGDEYDD